CFGAGGFDAGRRRDFAFFFVYEGGWGAAIDRDGWDCVPNQTSNFKDTPVEIIEHLYPLRCDEVRLRENSGGAGRHRGGLGSVRSYTVTSGAATVSLFSDRFRVRPYGVFEGWPGEANRVLVKRAGRETAETFASAYGRISP